MIKGIGTDLTEVGRIRSSIENYGERFINRIYTETEKEYCESFHETKYVHYAARFAAKEAFSKAVGTGITRGFKFREVGIVNLPGGKPEMVLEGEMKDKYGSATIHVSLSHTDGNAVAFVIMEEI